MSEPRHVVTVAATAPTAAYSDEAPVVILNPASNNGRAASLRRIIENLLAHGRGELKLTQAPGHATSLAEEAARAGRPLVVVGGDGAISEVASGLLRSGMSVPLGIVPAGSGNDYALRVAHTPLDPASALELALDGPVEAMDVGTVNGGYFINALGVGIDANCAVTAEGLKKFGLTGRALYMASAIRELLWNYDGCPELAIEFDGRATPPQVYTVVAMSIGPTYGGGFRINPTADPQDGLLDVCVLSKPPLPRAFRLLPMIERGQHVGQPEARFLRAQRMALNAREPVNAQVDGELIRAQRFEVGILPGALRLRRGPWPRKA